MILIERYDSLIVVDLSQYDTRLLKNIPKDKAAFYTPLSFKRLKQKKYIYPRFFDYKKYFYEIDIYAMEIFQNFESKIKEVDYRSRKTTSSLSLDISNLKYLRDDQIEIIQKMSKTFPSAVKLNTGVGKTVIALSFIYGVYKPSLFIVDQKNLGDQFIDKVNTFIKKNIDRTLYVNDLRRFTTKKLIKYLEETEEVPSIYNLITVQKLLNIMKEVDIFKAINLFRKFEVVFYDEAHTTSSSFNYGLTSMIFDTDYMYGLTATPYFAMKDFIKELYFYGAFPNLISLEEDKKDKILSSAIESLKEVKIIFFTEENEIKKKFLKIIYKSKDPFLFYRTYYISKVVNNSKKFKQILFKVLDKYYKEGRKVLITAKSIETVEYLYSILSEKFENVSLYTALKKKGDNLTSLIQVSTFDIVKKGYDDKNVEVIINLFPVRTKTGIIQLIGRALRKSDKSKNPEYIEIIPMSITEEFPPFKSRDLLYRYLKEEYKDFKYKVYEV